MKEVVISAGGRRLYNEDILNIQDHLISVQSLFASEKPFVISGVEYTNTSGTIYDITSGVVWLGGKIRNSPAITGVDLSVPRFIVVSDTQESRLYDDNVTRVALDVFAAIHSDNALSTNDTLRIDEVDNTRRYYRDVLGGQYVQLNETDLQNVASALTVDGNITSGGSIYATNALSVNGHIQGNNTATIIGELNVFGGIATGETQIVELNGDIATDRVKTASIANDSVTTEKIGDSQVSNDKLAGGITGDKIPFNQIQAEHIQPLAIQNSHLSSESVSQDKLSFNTIETKGDTITSTGQVTVGANSTFFLLVTHNLGDAGYVPMITMESSSSHTPLIAPSFSWSGRTANEFYINISNHSGSSAKVSFWWYLAR